ncbi:hypothetical protein OF83DRAFT_625869 [Amylostereum chailletii]|nr:hypothetical protein OF83DRAFT_625869 [Amylostereum chailletii]
MITTICSQADIHTQTPPDVLRNMPLLGVLDLEFVLPPTDGGMHYPQSRMVSFPCLRQIELSGNTPQECVDFISCLDCPNVTTIVFSGIDVDEEDMIDPIISTLQQHYRNLTIPIGELYVDMDEDELEIQAKDIDKDILIFRIAHRIHEADLDSTSSPATVFAHYANHFITSLPVRDVERVDCSFCFLYDDISNNNFSVEIWV